LSAEVRERLERAKARLDRLDFYPRPVRIDRVRVVTLPLFFKIPGFRRFSGFTLHRTILLKKPLVETSDNLLTHELCHVWQGQHRAVRLFFTWFTTRYEKNPFEDEARRADRGTREPV
jgi:hypothetical protein